jgi:Caspase domain
MVMGRWLACCVVGAMARPRPARAPGDAGLIARGMAHLRADLSLPGLSLPGLSLTRLSLTRLILTRLVMTRLILTRLILTGLPVQRVGAKLAVRGLAVTGLIVMSLIGTGLGFGGAARANELRVEGGELRALVIGIDDYRSLPRLGGAVADARDLAATLRGGGVRDVTTLLDADADRARVMSALDDLLARSRGGDLVVLAMAGYGAQEAVHLKSAQKDIMDNVYLLAGFDPQQPDAAAQRILQSEFHHVLRQFEARGAHVLFVADASYGGGVMREEDPRAAAQRYRLAAPYSLKADNLKAIATAQDAMLRASDFPHTAFLLAGERAAKTPEVQIPGVGGVRGALSYALARALEGAADDNHDGRITQAELFGYVRQVAYQLSDQRQHVEATGPEAEGAGFEVAYSRSRAVVLLDTTEKSEPRPAPPQLPAQPQSQPQAQPQARPQAQPQATVTPSAPSAKSSPAPALPPKATTPLETVRLAVLGNAREALKGLEARDARYDVVATTDNPDLVWDPVTLDVLAGPDVVAHGIERGDLPNVIDRLAVVKGFKRMSASAPQTLRILPNDKLQRRDARVEVQVSGVAQRALLLFNIAGDGTVQALYPIGSDQPVITTADYKFPVVVGEPFGAEQVIAITSAQRLGDLEQALKKMNQRRSAVEVYKLVERYAPPDTKIGVTSLYTSP